MNKAKINIIFSPERTKKYFDFFPENDELSIELYKANISLSGKLYPLLSILEVALRNCINSKLSIALQNDSWTSIMPIKSLEIEIRQARDRIISRREAVSHHKIIAELTFGFWTRLFNAEFEKSLWKYLRNAFPNMPKRLKKRANISAPLNRIRKLRNRIYHNEPIIWQMDNVDNIIQEIYKILGWLDLDLVSFAREFDNTDREIKRIRDLLRCRNTGS